MTKVEAMADAPHTTDDRCSITQGTLQDFAPGEGVTAGAQSPGFDDHAWLPIDIPGGVHRTLLAAGRIPDPFYDQNEKDVAWMEEREWWYRMPLTIPEAPLNEGERMLLVFTGVDTFATFYLDGQEIGRSENMFRPAEFDISEQAKPGATQTLAICFHPPLLAVEDRPKGPWPENDPRTAMRKAQYGFGWDWGPRLPTIGLWRPAELRRVRGGTITGVHLTTVELAPDARQAVVKIRVEAEPVSPQGPLSAEITLAEPGSDRRWQATVTAADEEEGLDQSVYLTIPEPKLWWTHDLGDQPLYTLSVILKVGDRVADSTTVQAGIRTIVLDQAVDTAEPGTRFFRFFLNGVPTFAKGANWIPADSFVGAIPDARYTNLLTLARDANMTMLRVWGGGIYEHDIFYDECDRLGILVWQDFMFACAGYPENEDFAREVDLEARYQVRRLRSHPCMALWCGNNENQWITDSIYWNRPKPPYGELYYNVIIPEAVATLDGSVPYWPGSPYGGDDYNSMEDGDRHNWDAWHGQFPRRFGEEPRSEFTPESVSYRRYGEDLGRFISEFGLHASPVVETLRRAIPEDQRFHHSASMDWHNKDTPKNKGDMLMESVTGVPETLEDYIDFSQIAQADGLKFGIEHFRRRTPHCSGALVWQLNDCWPVLSWSVIDYDGFGKAGYYYLGRVFSPVLASFREEGDAVALWITNDTRLAVTDTVTVTLGAFSGDVLHRENVEIAVGPHTSAEVRAWPAPSDGADRYLRAESGSALFPANRHFFVPIKDLKRAAARPELTFAPIDPHTLRATVAAPADGYAYFVHLGCPVPGTRFSDNFIDLAPGERRTLTVTNEAHELSPDHIRLGWR